MAPRKGEPRGRRQTLNMEIDESLTANTISTRPSSVRRSTRLDLLNASKATLSSEPPTIDGDEASSSAFPSTSGLGEYLASTKEMTGKGKERESLSSASISNGHNEGSGYSTPATSAFATPAEAPEPSKRRRGRRATTIPNTDPNPTVSSIARATALRSSQFSLNPFQSAKRKRIPDSQDDEELDGDEELDADEDDSPDAQLARALQKDEDEAADAMDIDTSDLVSRRTARGIRKLLPKDGYASDLDEDDDMSLPLHQTKRPKVELRSQGFNSMSFPHKHESKNYDLEELPDFFDTDSEDSDAPITTSRARKLCKSAEVTGSSESSASLDSSGSELALDTGDSGFSSDGTISSDDAVATNVPVPVRSRRAAGRTINVSVEGLTGRAKKERHRLEQHHPVLQTMWKDLENLPKIGDLAMEQPKNITRELKPFQLQGVAWMKAMEDTEWGGGLLGDEMGMGKTIQAVSLIMSDWPAKQPTLVLIPPVALMQWQQEIASYTDGTLKTFVYHGTNLKTKGLSVKDLMQYNVILISYNSLESMYRKQEKGFKRKNGIHKEKSIIHQLRFHRIILDEAHNIKQRTSGCAKACFALKADHKWCLSGTPLQNRIGELFSLIRFLDIRPFACYFCKNCDCSKLNWEMDGFGRCTGCRHTSMQHVSVFNQELLNPIQKFGNRGPGIQAFRKLRILTDRFMLRRVKRDHSASMELPSKEIYIDRQFFGEEENDFAGSIMNNGTRKFETYVAQGVLLNNYANIFGLIMQMRQVADHPDLILKKNGEGGQNVLVCCICDDVAEEAIRSACKHDFCRECAKRYLNSSDIPDCPTCHIPLSIDLEQPDIEQDEQQVKKNSIINRIKMENWTSSSKIEALVHDLHELRSKNMSHKSIIFSQFTTMLQLVEWRLRRAGITTVMLDGSMTPAQRQGSINHFMTDVNVECFLVSLKAGGVALNLTEASKVFIVDPWWNPAAEWQSADRCHRIGQARPCSITRLCIEDSVESRIVLLQEKKANMINSTINSDDQAMESMTAEDMQFLFRGN